MRDTKKSRWEIFGAILVAFCWNIVLGIISPNIKEELATKWQKELKLQSFLLLPILSKNKPVGLVVFGCQKTNRKLTSLENNFLHNVIDQTGIALDNLILYEKLQENIEKLKRTNVRLRELDRMKDEFVSIASHELRTPMTSINGYVWMVLNGKAGEITDKQRLYLERAALSTKRLINLVEDMLTVSRISAV